MAQRTARTRGSVDPPRSATRASREPGPSSGSPSVWRPATLRTSTAAEPRIAPLAVDIDAATIPESTSTVSQTGVTVSSTANSTANSTGPSGVTPPSSSGLVSASSEYGMPMRAAPTAAV